VTAVNLADVERAAARLAGQVVRTPCLRSDTLSDITGAEVWLKFENLQYTASFKERGARNFLESLDPSARSRGVVAASAGNHAQGVAYHARLLGVPATIVMPESTPFTKVSRTELERATVVIEGGDFGAAYAHARAIAADTGATFVPAFDDARIVAGAGTVGLEIVEQVPDFDAVIVPVGGGGLLAGIAIAVKTRRPAANVVGVQSETHTAFARAFGRSSPAAPHAAWTIASTTIAEGIAVPNPGELTVAIARSLVDDIVVVREATIEAAITDLVEVEKTVVEGAGAAGLAALTDHAERFADRRCVIVLTGGNIDLRSFSSVVMRALARSGRLVRYRCRIPDLPGQLARVADIVGHERGNIIDVEHHRDRPGVAVRDAILELSVETRDAGHAATIRAALDAAGFTQLADDHTPLA
jgi:threonine dehydratase